MPRRVQYSPKEINRMRGTNWEFHYNNHAQASCLGNAFDRDRVARIISREIPVPEMQIDGSELHGMATLVGKMKALDSLGLTIFYRDLMCAWYWSQAGWDNFVHLFQSLPEVEENYYLLYDAELDAARMVPMSSKAIRSVSTSQVHPRTTDRLVHNQGMKV